MLAPAFPFPSGLVGGFAGSLLAALAVQESELWAQVLKPPCREMRLGAARRFPGVGASGVCPLDEGAEMFLRSRAIAGPVDPF